MLAVFQSLSGVGNLGSIRSARPYYLELALGHDALLVHAGASEEAYSNMKSWGVDHMDGVNGGSDAAIFWRDSARRQSAGYEHSLLTSGDKVLGYLAKGRFRLAHKPDWSYPLTFVEDGTPAGGSPASHVKLVFSNYKTGLFDYDEGTGHYLVSEYGKKYVDGNTGVQVEVTNVIFLETEIKAISGDSAGRIRVKTTGSGKGTFFCGGKSVPIRWSKADKYSPFVYTLTDGTPLALGQGVSYVCIFSPSQSNYSVS